MKIKDVAKNPHASNRNLTKLQEREGYRLRVGGCRVIYELQIDRLGDAGFGRRGEGRNLLMHIEKITRRGKEFAVIPLEALHKLMDDAEMLADVKAYDSMAKGRLKRGEDELIPFEITERRLAGESSVKIWREYREFTQEELSKRSEVSRAMIAAIETGRQKGRHRHAEKAGGGP